MSCEVGSSTARERSWRGRFAVTVAVALACGQPCVSGPAVIGYWTPAGGKERLIAKTSAFTFWPELSKTFTTLAWVGADFAPTNGKLRILYKGMRDFQGQTFFDSSVQVDRSAIKMNN